MKSQDPFFSVITPLWGGWPEIQRCVGSVRGQVNCGGVEHLIQHGGGDDASGGWLDGQEDVRVFREPDGGMYDAINKGWARARGEVLSWLNADEQLLPGTLEKVSQVFRAHPDADVVYGDTLMVTPSGDPLAARKEIPLRAVYVANGFLYALSCSMFFHRRLWDDGLLRIDDDFRSAGDMELVLRLLRAGRVFRQVPAYLSLFGVSGTNLTVTHSDRMKKEMARVRRRYGGCRHGVGRRMVLMGRTVERLVRGCYGPHDVSYRFARTEEPAYRRVDARRVSGRFTYERAARMIAATPQGETPP